MDDNDSAAPTPPAPQPPRRMPDDPRGSLGAGFGIGCLILIVGPSFAAAWIGAVTALAGTSDYPQAWIAVIAAGWLLPVVALVWAVVHFVRKGKTRTAKGIGAAVLALLALGLLLVAACAVMLSGLDFR